MKYLSITLVLVSLLTINATRATIYEKPKHDPNPNPNPNPNLKFDSSTGKFFVANITDASLSIEFDRAVQAAVAEAKFGPTRAAAAYAIVHTSIYEVWVHNEKQKSTRLTIRENEQLALNEDQIITKSTIDPYQKAKMAYAGFFALQRSVNHTSTQKIASDVLERTLLPISDDQRESARVFAEEIALQVVARYEQNILESIPRSPLTSIEKWTAENVPIDDPQGPVQKSLTPEWGTRFTFGICDGSDFTIPPPKRFLLTNASVDLERKAVRLHTGYSIPIVPEIVGSIINPEFIEQAVQVVHFSANLTDETKVIAEMFEAGTGTSYPPGQWLTFAQYISARDQMDASQDVIMFYLLSNALNDAGVATWYAKTKYDYARPVRAIRDLAKLGLIGTFDVELSGFADESYDIAQGSVRLNRLDEFVTYQLPNADPSPPFPEYTSGHSGFSEAGAEILRRFTGSNHFGEHVTVDAGGSRFEPGRSPSNSVTLSFDTFSSVSKLSGISRLHGGIHFEDGNIFGNELGKQVSDAVFNRGLEQLRNDGVLIGERRSSSAARVCNTT